MSFSFFRPPTLHLDSNNPRVPCSRCGRVTFLGGDNGTRYSECSSCREVPCSAFTWGGTRRECTLVVIEVSWSPFMGLGSGAPHVLPGGGYSEAPHVRHLVGYWSEGVNGATWCNSLLGRLLRGRSDTPQSGIGAQRYPFICSCLIINYVWICGGLLSYGSSVCELGTHLGG